jgi:Calx-beta domain
MSNRSNIASADKVGAYGCRSRFWAWTLAILIATCAVAPGVARADALVLTNGEVIEGSIVDATRNTVIVRRAIGGMRQMRIQDIAEVRILVQGETIAGQLLGWADGVHQIGTGGEILRIGAGRIISRERHEQATTQPPRSLSARILPLRRQPSGPAEGPMVEVVAPAATATDVTPAEVERVEVKRPQAATAEVAPTTDSVAETAPTKIATAKVTPAAPAPAVVGPAQIVAAPDKVATPVVSGAGDSIGEFASAEVRGAAVAVAEASPAFLVAISRAAAAELGTAKIATAPVSTATVAAATVAPAEATADEAAVLKVAATQEAESDGQRVTVRTSVDPAEAGAAGIIFRIELSRPAEQAVVLIYGTVDGTAVAGQDYEPQQGVMTLANGTKNADVHVPLIEHRRPRGDARFDLFVTADPKVAEVIDQRVSATIPAAD